MKKGFTLIELLVVVTIILLLSGLGVVAFTGAQRKARDNKRKSDLEQVRSALEMFRDDNDVYPAGNGWSQLDVLVTDNYIDELPLDPKGYSYYYGADADGYTYYLCAYLEAGNGGALDCTTQCAAPEDCNYEVSNP
jgi:general secretion pathway protein G